MVVFQGPIFIHILHLSLSLSLCIGLYAWREREGERESPRTCIEIHTCKQARKIRWQMIEMHFSGYIYNYIYIDNISKRAGSEDGFASGIRRRVPGCEDRLGS